MAPSLVDVAARRQRQRRRLASTSGVEVRFRVVASSEAAAAAHTQLDEAASNTAASTLVAEIAYQVSQELQAINPQEQISVTVGSLVPSTQLVPECGVSVNGCWVQLPLTVNDADASSAGPATACSATVTFTGELDLAKRYPSYPLPASKTRPSLPRPLLLMPIKPLPPVKAILSDFEPWNASPSRLAFPCALPLLTSSHGK